MNNFKTFNHTKIRIFSKENILSEKLKELLENKDCIVEKVLIGGKEQKEYDLSKYNYAVIDLCGVDAMKEKSILNHLRMFNNLTQVNTSVQKTLIILDDAIIEFIKNKKELSEIINSFKFNNSTIIFLGEIIDNGKFVGENGIFGKTYSQILRNNFSLIGKKIERIPNRLDEYCEQIVKLLFSMAYSGKIVHITSKKIKRKDLNKIMYLMKKTEYPSDKERRREDGLYDEEIELKYRGQYSDLVKVFSKLKKPEINSDNKISKSSNDKDNKEKRGISPAKYFVNYQIPKIKLKKRKTFFSFILFLLAPFLITFFQMFNLYALDLSLKNNIEGVGSMTIFLSDHLYETLDKVNVFYEKIPIIGKYYKNISHSQDYLLDLSNINKERYLIYKKLFELYRNLNNEELLTKSIQNLSSELEFYKKETLFLQDGVQNTKIPIGSMVKKLNIRSDYDKSNIDKLKNLLASTMDLIGKGKDRTYLMVLFNEKKPKGLSGEFEAFYLFKLNNGEIRNFEEINDEILNKGTTILNTEDLDILDFDTLSQSIIKSTKSGFDVDLNGIVFMDHRSIKNIIKKIGKLKFEDEEYLSLYNFDKYFYLSNDAGRKVAVIDSLLKLEKDKHTFIDIINSLNESLNDKDIFIYYPDDSLTRTIDGLGWGGKPEIESCSKNCYSDFLGIFESFNNILDENIKRKIDYEINIEEGLIKRTFSYTIQNTGTKQESLYIKVLTPNDVSVSSVELSTDGSRSSIIPSVKGGSKTKEVGFAINVEAGKALNIVLRIESGYKYDFDIEGKYKLKVIKQYGTDPFDLSVYANFPKDKNYKLNNLNLTEGSIYRYNSSLDKSKEFSIIW